MSKATLRIEINKETYKYVLKKLKGMESEVPKVMSRAANKTAISARVSLVKELRRTYTEKSGRAKRSITIKKASYGNPVAVIKSTDKSQAATYFHYSGGGRGGVKLQVRSDHPFNNVVSSKERKAFVAKMSNGHTGIFQRQAGEFMDKSPRLSNPRISKQTKHTERLRQFLSPSSSKMVEMVYDGGNTLKESLKTEIENTLRKNIESQINYVLSKK